MMIGGRGAVPARLGEPETQAQIWWSYIYGRKATTGTVFILVKYTDNDEDTWVENAPRSGETRTDRY